MAPTVLRYGYKIFLDHDVQPGSANAGFAVATDNLMLPLGVRSNKTAGSLRIEHAVFQMVSGDGEVSLDITQKRLGEEIKFGQVVRLLHVSSNSFLCESRRLRATREKANQKVTLADFTSIDELRGSRWRVSPRYKVRSEGQKICNKDVIVLQSLSGDTTLHVCNTQDSSTDHYFEVNAGLTASGFKVQIYDQNSAQGEARELRCGDCIQLLHREERAFFVAQPQTMRRLSEITGGPRPINLNASATAKDLIVGADVADDDDLFDDVILEDAPESTDGQELLNSNSMFVVESDNTFAGGSVAFGSRRKFRLKSLSTGRYLSALRRLGAGRSGGESPVNAASFGAITKAIGAASKMAQAGQQAADVSATIPQIPEEDADDDDNRKKGDDIDGDIVVVLVKRKSDATMIYFDQAADDASSVARSHSRVFIVFPAANPMSDGRWLSCSSVQPGEDPNATSGAFGAVPGSARSRANSVSGLDGLEHGGRGKSKWGAVSKMASHKDGIELIKVPRQEFQSLNFVLSQLPPIRRLIKTLQLQATLPDSERVKHIPTYQLVNQVRENLSTLGRMCTNSAEDNVLVREGTPAPSAQNRLVDQAIPRLCLDLVDAVFCCDKFVTPESIVANDTTALEDKLLERQEGDAAAGAAPNTNAGGLLASNNAGTGAAGGGGSTGGTATQSLKLQDLLMVVKLAYRVIRLCSIQNTRTAIALLPHVDRLLTHVKSSFGAFEALAELYIDNPSTVYAEPLSSRLADEFIAYAREFGRSSGSYVYFLSLLASCKGIGIKPQQTRFGIELIANEVFTPPARVPKEPISGDEALKTPSQTGNLSPEKAPLAGPEPLFYRLWIEHGVVRVDHCAVGRIRPSTAPSRVHDANDSDEEDPKSGTALEDFANKDGADMSRAGGSRASFSRDSTAVGNALGTKLLQPGNQAYVLLRQIQFMTALCRGRHADNILRVRELYPPHVIMAIIKNEALAGDLRAACIDLLIAIEINVDPFRDETEAARSLVRVWDELPPTAESKNQKDAEYTCTSKYGVPTPVIEELKDFLRHFLDSHASLNPYDRPLNMSINSAVVALKTLAQLGLVKETEFLEWIRLLTPVLDGRDDSEPTVTEAYRRKFGDFDRHRYDEDNHQLMVCKLSVIDVLALFAVFARAVAVSRLVLTFRHNGEIPHTATILDLRGDSYVDDESKKLSEERESRANKADGNFLQQGFGALTDVAGAGFGAMTSMGNVLLSVIPGQSDKEHPLKYLVNLVDVLVDIAQYEYAPLVVNAVTLLLTLLNSHRGVLQQLRNVQILQSAKSVKFFENAAPIVADLFKFSEVIIVPHDKDAIIEYINLLTKMILAPPKDGFDGSTQKPGAASQSTTATQLLGRDPEQHAILKNLGAHTAVAQLLRSIFQNMTGGDPTSGRVKPWVKEVITASYEFLEVMVRDSKPVAWDLFPNAEVFSRHLPLRLGSLNVLLCMFRGNVDLCSSLSDTVVQDIVLALSVTEFDPRVAHALRLLVYQDGQLIRRNQAPVLKCLLDGDDLVLKCRDVTTGNNGRKIRNKLLADAEYTDANSKVAFHTEIITIVAYCVTGRNDPQMRTEVRNALFASGTLDDVFEVLMHDSIPAFYRTSYFKLFTMLYLEDPSIRLQLLEHRKFVNFIERAFQSPFLTFSTAVERERMNPHNIQQGPYDAAASTSSAPSSPVGYGQPLVLSEEAEMYLFFRGLVPALKRMMQVHLADLGEDDETAHIDKAQAIKDLFGTLHYDMTETLASLLQFYPYQRPPDELIPGQIADEPEEEQTMFGGFGKLFSAKSETPKEKKRVEWVSPVPMRLRSGLDLFFDGAHSNNANFRGPLPRKVPLIPVEYLKDFAQVIDMIVECKLRNNNEDQQANEKDEELADFNMTQPTKVVAEYVAPTELDDHDLEADSLKLFSGWQKFCDKYEETVEGTCEESAFRSAAIVIMRKSRQGHNLVRSLIRILDNSLLDDFTRESLLHTMRQLIMCEDDDLSDASILLKEPDEIILSAKEKAARINAWEIEAEILSLKKSQAERQNIFAAWQAPFSLPPKLVVMLSKAPKPLLIATLKCLNELLRDGNARVQAVVLNWARDRSDEDFFMQIRTRMVQCREQLRDRRRAIRRDIGDDFARTEKLSSALHVRLARRFNFDVPLLFLELVQLLCEGHNTEMQNYFRIQMDNQVSINVLESVTGVLEVLVKFVDSATMDLATQTVATITELLQGPCHENQDFMVSQNIGDIITRVFTSNYYDISDDDRWTLRSCAVTLLLSLMEGHMDIGIISTLMQSLDLAPLVNVMDTTYRQWADERGLRDSSNPVEMAVDLVKEVLKGLFVGLGEGNEFEDTLNLSCNIFVFLKTILDVEMLQNVEQQAGPGVQDNLEPMNDKTGKTIKELFRGSQSYKRLSRKVATIEIRRNGRLEKVYFRIPSICVYNLKKESKENLIWEIGRNGDGERIADFFERSFGLIREMEYYEEMRQTRGLSLVHKYDPVFDNLSLLVAFTINLFLLFTIDYENASNSNSHLRLGDIEETYYALGLIQIINQCFLFCNFFFGPTRIYLEDRWNDFREFMNRHAVEESKQTLGIEPPKIDPDPEKKLPFFARWLLSLIFLLFWPAFYKRMLFLVIAFIGFYYSPIWYCIQMLQIISKSPLLQNVVKSVTLNWKSLLLTGCLLLVVVYIFSIIAYFNYSGNYGNDNMGAGNNCDTLIRCATTHLVYGLKFGGGISEVTPPPIFGADEDVSGYLRLLFDFLFFLILIIMFLNLVFGIILDTFGQLREHREFVEEDQKGKCFICGMERSEFDRVAAGGFDQHIEFDHHMWDYLYFMHYVKLKPSEDHNGQEGFVATCMESHEPLFYPIGQAMVVEAHVRGEKADLPDEEGEGGAGGDAGKAGGAAGAIAEAAADDEPTRPSTPAAFNNPTGDEGAVVARLQHLEELLQRMIIMQTHPTASAATAAAAPRRQ
jgi:hypothetical protein